MIKRSVLGAWRFVVDRCRWVLQALARFPVWVFACFRNAFRQNLLLGWLRGKKVSAPEAPAPQPQLQPQTEPSGNVVPFPQRPLPAPKPNAPFEVTNKPQPNSIVAIVGDVGLALVTSASAILMIGLLVHMYIASRSDDVVSTGVNETTVAQLPGAGTVALGARSTVNMDALIDEQRVAVEEGEAIFDVSRDAVRPLTVETFLAKARAEAGSKFRVKIDSSVEFELFAGVVAVFPYNATGKPAKIALKIGVPYRVPVDTLGAMRAAMSEQQQAHDYVSRRAHPLRSEKALDALPLPGACLRRSPISLRGTRQQG